MKKLTRKQLRSILLKEATTIAEESAPQTLLNAFKKQEEIYEKAYNEGGLVHMAKQMIIELPLISMKAGYDLLTDESFTSEFSKKLDDEGFGVAYTFWLESLYEKMGYPINS